MKSWKTTWRTPPHSRAPQSTRGLEIGFVPHQKGKCRESPQRGMFWFTSNKLSWIKLNCFCFISILTFQKCYSAIIWENIYIKKQPNMKGQHLLWQKRGRRLLPPHCCPSEAVGTMAPGRSAQPEVPSPLTVSWTLLCFTAPPQKSSPFSLEALNPLPIAVPCTSIQKYLFIYISIKKYTYMYKYRCVRMPTEIYTSIFAAANPVQLQKGYKDFIFGVENSLGKE